MAHSPAPDQGTDTTRNALYRRITLRLIPFIFICYLFNYLASTSALPNCRCSTP